MFQGEPVADNEISATKLVPTTNRTSEMMIMSLGRRCQCVPKVLLVLSMFYFLRTIATDEEAVEYSWEPYQYPNLGVKSAKHCAGRFRNPPTSVCDPDMVLRASEANSLDSLIDTTYNGTACFCPPCADPQETGLVIKVAAVHTFKHDTNFTLNENVQHFAERLQKTWDVGGKCQHGVIIFVSAAYNKIYLAMGQKAERVVGRRTANNLAAEGENLLKQGQYYKALELIVTGVKKEAKSYNPRWDILGLGKTMWISIMVAISALIIVIFLLWVWIKRESKKRYRRNQSNQSRVQMSKLNDADPSALLGKDTKANKNTNTNNNSYHSKL